MLLPKGWLGRLGRWLPAQGDGGALVGNRGPEVSRDAVQAAVGADGSRTLPLPRCLHRKSIWCAVHVSAGLPVRIEDALFHTIACLHGARSARHTTASVWRVRSCLLYTRTPAPYDPTATMQVSHMAHHAMPSPSPRRGAAAAWLEKGLTGRRHEMSYRCKCEKDTLEMAYVSPTRRGRMRKDIAASRLHPVGAQEGHQVMHDCWKLTRHFFAPFLSCLPDRLGSLNLNTLLRSTNTQQTGCHGYQTTSCMPAFETNRT
jgi:hypothetical protein